jgi:hypothetical protein
MAVAFMPLLSTILAPLKGKNWSRPVQIQSLAQPPQNGFLGRTGRNTQLVESPPACHQFPYRLIRPTGSEFAGDRRT